MTGLRIERTASAHAVPRHMHSPIYSKGELCAANGAHRHGGVRAIVNRDSFGEAFRPRFASNIEDIAAFGLAFVIDEVDDTFSIHSGLWLDATVWSAEQLDLLPSGTVNGEQKQERNDRPAGYHGITLMADMLTGCLRIAKRRKEAGRKG